MAPAAQAQECGEQFQLQDDLQYALDGLCSSALPADRAASAAKLAQMAVTRRGRLAFRSVDCPGPVALHLALHMLECAYTGLNAYVGDLVITCCGCRAGGLFQDVMIAGSKLRLDREPLTALAFSIMLLAFARDRAEQAALRQDSSLAVLTLLLQVRA